MSGTASKTATLADYILEGARSHYVTDSASLRSHAQPSKDVAPLGRSKASSARPGQQHPASPASKACAKKGGSE